jgi:long-subunit acyl-CoA synthetase (AMP-forming)
MSGYENNPEANAASFIDGWLRTGDRGFLDEEDYL